MNILGKIKDYLSLIRFEHTIFALPFALASAVVAAQGVPPVRIIFYILLAMVGARSAAMAFNRIVDRKIDSVNPRTRMREIPAGKIKLWEAWVLMIIAIILFEFSAWRLNSLAFALSPVALIVVLGYSLTKRFTSLSHLVLGLALGIAPVGAWVAVTGSIDLAPIILSAAVMLWTAGFDIIYSLQDEAFDKKNKLFSLPQALGAVRALTFSRLMHVAVVVLLILFGVTAQLGAVYFIGIAVIAACLVYEHCLVKPDDLSRVNAAFFTVNGWVSVVYVLFVLMDLLLR